jgi:peptidoglycan/xylan/chitin deacetylase (PgdA/CDA1 family)
MLTDGNLVVTYHYVRPTSSDGVTGITPQEFDQHLAEIGRRFEFVSADDFVASHQRRSGMALITFDDATRDQFEFASPVLARHGVKAVFYAPMRPFSDEPNRWCSQHLLHALAQELGWSEFERRVNAVAGKVDIDCAAMDRLYHYEVPHKRRLKYVLAFALSSEDATRLLHQINANVGLRAEDWYMSADQVRELQGAGHALGGHGFDHVPFTTLLPPQQAIEMHRAVSTMNRLFGRRSRTIAWPFGRFDDHTILIAQQCGYTLAFSTEDRVDAKFLLQHLQSITSVERSRHDNRHHHIERQHAA